MLIRLWYSGLCFVLVMMWFMMLIVVIGCLLLVDLVDSIMVLVLLYMVLVMFDVLVCVGIGVLIIDFSICVVMIIGLLWWCVMCRMCFCMLGMCLGGSFMFKLLCVIISVLDVCMMFFRCSSVVGFLILESRLVWLLMILCVVIIFLVCCMNDSVI